MAFSPKASNSRSMTPPGATAPAASKSSVSPSTRPGSRPTLSPVPTSPVTQTLSRPGSPITQRIEALNAIDFEATLGEKVMMSRTHLSEAAGIRDNLIRTAQHQFMTDRQRERMRQEHKRVAIIQREAVSGQLERHLKRARAEHDALILRANERAHTEFAQARCELRVEEVRQHLDRVDRQLIADDFAGRNASRVAEAIDVYRTILAKHGPTLSDYERLHKRLTFLRQKSVASPTSNVNMIVFDDAGAAVVSPTHQPHYSDLLKEVKTAKTPKRGMSVVSLAHKGVPPERPKTAGRLKPTKSRALRRFVLAPTFNENLRAADEKMICRQGVVPELISNTLHEAKCRSPLTFDKASATVFRTTTPPLTPANREPRKQMRLE
ncbi:unnamed protein product [Vitrella brassicaformis CCMP3155]|uniref:Uncharacterized protein n=1 Tax=Vitrella brassicaformis (strain CCMP3155) TaxID=1169540 RepID=A0A0G4FDU7_VITBC|nr:unnamed protein product [Vitrella brassicaformis CCMP3155]|eukprot:CEM11139.1 unnamed protein product [Vitrella brassicaformis CCMP3155]